MSSSLKRTPLFEKHRQSGARLIEFGGWEMPVQYTSIAGEHLAVRSAAGLFDIAHMGEFVVSGASAQAFLNQVFTNDAAKLAPGQAQYSLMCNERGGVLDDLYVYRLAKDEFLLIVNAARIAEDFTWLETRLQAFTGRHDTQLRNLSEELGALAVQGPRVAEFIDQCFPGPTVGGTEAGRLSELKKNQIARIGSGGEAVWIARTGYTGEDGFELIAPGPLLPRLWDLLLERGGPSGLKPAGLGARDTLRTEMCYPLYGHELNESITPLEAGLGAFVSLEKSQFIGRGALLQQKETGLAKRCAAFKMVEKSAPPRPQYPIWNAGGTERIGEVVSGTQSPSLAIGIGLGYVAPEQAKAGTRIEIEIRGRRHAAQVVPKPIYRKPA